MNYVEEVCLSLHESSHLCAAISVGVEVRYAQIGSWEDDTAGKVRCVAHYEDGIIQKPEDHAFVSMAGIISTEIFHLTPHGLETDRENVRAYLSGMKPSVERKIRHKVRRYLTKNKSRVYRVAHALQILK